MASGNLMLGSIPALPDLWWDESDDVSVWTHWDRDTYYLWGANSGNYKFIEWGNLIGGDGMAGLNGPTKGRQHEHYVGVNTMSQDATITTTVFDELDTLLSNGKHVVVPTFHNKYSLGTGIAAESLDPGTWNAIQLDIFKRIDKLWGNAANVIVPPNTYWPDCSSTKDPQPNYQITSQADIKAIITVLGG